MAISMTKDVPLKSLPNSGCLYSKIYKRTSMTKRRKRWHPTPVLLPGKSHGRRSLVGCSPWGCEESDTTERLPFHFSLLTFMHWRRKWQPTPVFLSGKSHGWGSLVVCGPCVAGGRTRLSDFTFTFHFHALEKEMATHSSVLAWRIPGMRKPGGLPSMGSHRVRHD